MKTYNLNAQEIDLVLTALRFTTEHGYTYEIEHGGDLTDYYDMKALIEKLDPKPVQKEGWMLVWSNEARPSVFPSKQEAEAVLNQYKGLGKIIKITWEE